MKNIKPNSLLWLKYSVYLPANKIIVTDFNRKNLMPNFLLDKIFVVPNYTNYLKEIPSKLRNDNVTIMFYGWLGMNRGGRIIKKLLSFDNNLNIVMCGWFSDKLTKNLLEDKRVSYLGVLPQIESLNLVCSLADFILCVYDPINSNNINASPNKVYDGIQTGVPLIVNSEVHIAEYIIKNGLGVVFSSLPDFNEKDLYELLCKRKGTFALNENLKIIHSWENIEEEIYKAHRI